MKKFIAFTCIIFAFTLLSIFVAEKTDVLNLAERDLKASFTQDEDGRLTLSWERLPYPCFYKVETFSKNSGLINHSPDYHYITGEYTMKSSCPVPTSAIPMYYRVTAYGMFGRITAPSPAIANPLYAPPLAPVPISRYTKENPASLMPFLVWHVVPTAVCYEVEILSGPPDEECGTRLSKGNHLTSTRQVFTNGWQADLRPFQKEANLYWRARALGLHHEAIGEFCQAEPIYVSSEAKIPNSPLINDFDRMPDFKQPIYPVYDWIPLNGQKRYEVELLIHRPKVENNAIPTADRVWYRTVEDLSTCYDEYARPYAGEYYWRVRAIDEDGDTVGAYSDTAEFVVNAMPSRVRTAVFGDSITHGGGSLSYSPASLEYSYTTYLDFPAINLGRSGDTSHTTAERFNTDVLPLNPMNLLILTGSNSLRAAGVTASDVIEDLEAIRKACEKNDIRPIFLTLMPINPKSISYAFRTDTDPKWRSKLNIINNYIRRLPYHIDIEPYFYDATHTVMDYDFAIDGLHPDIRGKMMMGEIINQHQDLLR
ncbi:MAG: GDSL family lipase [Selenomonadaceae bacterium]|nr:GDSL family lipase [Selenomonadaceae bacterium]